MTFDAWLAADGTGAVHRLHLKTGVSLPAIARARKGRANLATATKLHLATGCKVPIASMTADDVPDELLKSLAANARKGRR
jgi:hypothetical protein